MGKHARLSPSGAEWWAGCPGGPAFVEGLVSRGLVPARSTSFEAAEGTFAHDVRALCQEYGFDAPDLIGMTGEADGYQFAVTPEMAHAIQPGLDWSRDLGGQRFIEVRVDISPWVPRSFGTSDEVIVKDRTIYV